MPDIVLPIASSMRQLTQMQQNSALQVLTPEDLSVPAREIMGRSPPWILRSGVTALACVLGMVLVLSFLIHYPDTISGRVTVTGSTPAVSLVAKQSGNLERLEVAEAQMVKTGQLLGVIKNSANSMQVLAVKTEIAKLLPFLADPKRFSSIPLDADLQLGPVQTAYSDFVTSYRNYETLIADDHAERTLVLVEKQLEQKRSQLATLRGQGDSSDRQVDLAKQSLERMRRLYQSEAISMAEMQNQERAYLEQHRQGSTLAKQLMEEDIAINEYEKQLSDLRHQRMESLRLGRLNLSESLKKLTASIEAWESDYVLRAPIDGRIGFYDFWREQQYVTAGKTVIIVVPDAALLMGRMPTKQGGAGKIAPGQMVRIKLDDFPNREFGVVSGEVRSVSLVAQQGEQLVTVSIPYPLKTHLGRELPFKQEMTGEASIVTQDYRLIERIFHSIASALKSPNRT